MQRQHWGDYDVLLLLVKLEIVRYESLIRALKGAYTMRLVIEDGELARDVAGELKRCEVKLLELKKRRSVFQTCISHLKKSGRRRGRWQSRRWDWAD